MKLKIFAVVIGIGILSGCTHTAVVPEADKIQATQFLNYQCDSGESFDVAYLSESAILKFKKQQYRLIQIEAASGTRYILDDGTKAIQNPIMLQTKGDEAMLEAGRVIYRNCSVKS